MLRGGTGEGGSQMKTYKTVQSWVEIGCVDLVKLGIMGPRTLNSVPYMG